MRVRKLLWGRMVTAEFADWRAFGCRNQIREEQASRPPSKWCRMCRFRSGCNTVPIEKGTETSVMPRDSTRGSGAMQHRPHREGD